MSHSSSRPAGHPPAFTLIEVLIAILILALGLLGLGAVFPVAVRAQRISSEDTIGTSAANSARAFLDSYNFRSAMVHWPNTNVPDNRNFWRDWRDDPVTNRGLNEPGPVSALDQGYWVVPAIDNNTNALTMGAPENFARGRPVSSQVTIPVRERLLPLGAAGDPPPLFVWDLAVHRVSDFNTATDSTHDDLELAVFVRRLDPRIKPAAGHNLYQVLTGERPGGVSLANRRRPVAVLSAGPQIDLPAGDGVGNYAAPVIAEVEFRFNPPSEPDRDRLYMFNNVTPAKWQLIRQPGQKLVDNLGQVHTVREWVENGADRFVVLEEPVRTLASSSGLIKQIVFTPQVPSSVFVMRVKP